MAPVPFPPPPPVRDSRGGAGRTSPGTGGAAPERTPAPPRPTAPTKTAGAGSASNTGKPETARRTPAPKPSQRTGPRDRAVPDPCATFHDLRRDYCYQFLDSLTLPRR